MTPLPAPWNDVYGERAALMESPGVPRALTDARAMRITREQMEAARGQVKVECGCGECRKRAGKQNESRGVG